MQYPIHATKISSIRVHPIESNYFALAGNKYKTVEIWDLRKMDCNKQNSSLSNRNSNNNSSCNSNNNNGNSGKFSDSKNKNKNISNGAVFGKQYSNVVSSLNWSHNGDRLLACGRDNYIHVYNSPAIYGFNNISQPHMSFQHNNNTGIWISMFDPVFHPLYPQIVITGNLEKKGIEIIKFPYYGINGKEAKPSSKMVGDPQQLRSVFSFGQFHSRRTDYLFGVTYTKVTMWRCIDSSQQDYGVELAG